jgi:hypothetical protein
MAGMERDGITMQLAILILCLVMIAEFWFILDALVLIGKKTITFFKWLGARFEVTMTDGEGKTQTHVYEVEADQ